MSNIDFVEYAEKVQAERKKRDAINIKIRKVVETSPPLDLCDEQRRIDYWSQVIAQHNQQYDKKIMIYKEQIALYERLIANITLERDKPDFRPRSELKRAQQDLELKKSYKPKELQKLEIDLEVSNKKINSFETLMGISRSVPPDPPTPHTPSDKIEEATEIKIEESTRMAKLDPVTGKRPVKRVGTPAPAPVKLEDPPAEQPKVPEQKVAEPQHYSDNFGNNPKLLLSTKRPVNKN
jgi:hypothetical protein